MQRNNKCLGQEPHRSSSGKKNILLTSRLKKASLFRTISNVLQIEISVVIFKPNVERLHSTFIQNTTHVFLALALLKMRVVKTVSLNTD